MRTDPASSSAPDGPAPGDAPQAAGAAVEFPCAGCGAGMAWDPAADALGCEHCGARVPVPRGEGTIVERPLSEAGAAARGLGLEQRVTRCETCGARVSFETSATARRCAYCGSANVLAQDQNRNTIRPESLLPLTLSSAEVEQAFRRWLGRLWFRPTALRRAASHSAAGIYVPFWTFDARVHSSWSADAGHHYWVNESHWTTVQGRRVLRTRRVRHTRWVPAWGQRDDAYDDLLVLASKFVSGALVERLGGFDTSALVPYRPEYLAGWSAEEYDLDLEQGWERAQQDIARRQEARCAANVPGDTHRFLRVENRLSDVRWKHVLLPVWSLVYRHRGKDWSVLVHGTTGRVHGQAPFSAAKILAAVALVLVLAALVLLVVRS